MYCSNCGARIDDDALRCPRCGTSLDAGHKMNEALPVKGRILNLPEAIANALQEHPQGLELLNQPNRFLGSIMDVTDNQSTGVRILISNCDNELLREFYNPGKVGTLEAIEDASSRTTFMLAEQRFIVKSAAKVLSEEIAQGVGAYLGLCGIETSVGSAPCDVFLCCKENEDATGEKTRDGELAAQLANELVAAGCSVFYPRLSLRERHPSTHEAVVRESLQNALVFVAVGTTESHLNCEWVKSCANAYLLSHLGGSDNAMVVYNGISAHDIPRWLGGMAALEIASKESVSYVIRAISRRVRMVHEVNSRFESGKQIQCEAKTMLKDATKIEAVQIEALSDPCIAIIKYGIADGSGYRRVKTSAIEKGGKAFVPMGPNAHIESVEAFKANGKEMPGSWLTWFVKSLMGTRLTIQVVNKSIHTIGMQEIALIVHGAVDSLIDLKMETAKTLHAYDHLEMVFALNQEEMEAEKRARNNELCLGSPHHVVIPRVE